DDPCVAYGEVIAASGPVVNEIVEAADVGKGEIAADPQVKEIDGHAKRIYSARSICEINMAGVECGAGSQNLRFAGREILCVDRQRIGAPSRAAVLAVDR